MAQYATLQTLINDVTTRLGLVPGSSVQTYGEPQITAAINDIFEFLYAKNKWKHLWKWHTFTINGTTGLTTTDWTTQGITRWEDIADIRIGNSRGPSVVRAVADEALYVTGSDAMYWEPLLWDDDNADTKLVKFYPVDVTSTIAVYAGHRPASFTDPDGIVPFDANLMRLGSVWKTLSADGLNANGAAEAQASFESAFQDYMANTSASNIGHGSEYRDDRTVLISP